METIVTLVKKPCKAQREHWGRVLIKKVMEISSYPPSEGKEEVRWGIPIRKSDLAEGYTVPSNYPSARPDIRIKIRHWLKGSFCQGQKCHFLHRYSSPFAKHTLFVSSGHPLFFFFFISLLNPPPPQPHPPWQKSCGPQVDHFPWAVPLDQSKFR